MDLPSMSRVTKLPLDTLKELAKTTPVFAPGLDQLLQMDAVAEIWDPKKKPLDDQLEEALRNTSPADTRDELGAQRKGRAMVATVAKRVNAVQNYDAALRNRGSLTVWFSEETVSPNARPVPATKVAIRFLVGFDEWAGRTTLRACRADSGLRSAALNKFCRAETCLT
jgi:hypothetical protein